MKILGISSFFHDSSAALVIDGKVVCAAAEERFSRLKHDNRFPIHAIQYCLDASGLAINELDYITYYEKPILKFERVLMQHAKVFPKGYKAFVNTIQPWLSQKMNIKEILEKEFQFRGKIEYIPHHLSHAASAYYLSGFKESAILTVDGVGEWATTTFGYGAESTVRIEKEQHFPHSLGLVYSAITTFLGFSANDAEYKVMGLAAYGKPERFRSKMAEIIKIDKSGLIKVNMNVFSYDSSDQHMFTDNLSQFLELKPRIPESEMEVEYANLAASLQERLEECMWILLNALHKMHPVDSVCIAGGVALNSVMNGKIQAHTPFKHVFIPPDPGDAGGAMGAALWGSIQHAKPEKKKEVQSNLASSFSPYLGPEFHWDEIIAVLQKNNLSWEFISSKKKLTKRVAKLLSNEMVIGWFQGRMEWGPRALGNRSILASAAKEEMKDIINARVKHRELFRPFAPAILEEYVSKYFKVDGLMPKSAKWMLMVYPFIKSKRKLLPAVVHVDGTGRLQTICRADNPLYYDLIHEYKQISNIPAIINTSFNVRGEPIVCTPEDAVQCFLRTDIDVLCIDQFLIFKDRVSQEKKKRRTKYV